MQQHAALYCYFDTGSYSRQFGNPSIHYHTDGKALKEGSKPGYRRMQLKPNEEITIDKYRRKEMRETPGIKTVMISWMLHYEYKIF